MKLLIYIFIIINSLFLIGCAEKIQYVNIPQKCQTDIPPQIQPTDNSVENVKLITERLELMECKVRYCKGETLTQCESNK